MIGYNHRNIEEDLFCLCLEIMDQGIHICDETIQKYKDQLGQCIELLERQKLVVLFNFDHNLFKGFYLINKWKFMKGGIPLKDDRRISILEKLFIYRL